MKHGNKFKTETEYTSFIDSAEYGHYVSTIDKDVFYDKKLIDADVIIDMTDLGLTYDISEMTSVDYKQKLQEYIKK